MVDDCCSFDGEFDAESAPERLRDVPALRFAVLSGALLAAGLIIGRWVHSPTGIALEIAALVAGAWTFVPETLRGLVRGRLGVGTLMTIAAAGAVALGELGEAAMLAFLFSIAEGLEGYAITRTRRGLRACWTSSPTKHSFCEGAAPSRFAPRT